MNEGDLQQQVFDLEDRIDDLEMENKKLRAQIELKDLVRTFYCWPVYRKPVYKKQAQRQVSGQSFKGQILQRKMEQGFKNQDLRQVKNRTDS